MKTRILLRAGSALTAALFAVSSTSCMTAYDAEGRPIQTVDPGLATAGVIAAGVLGYAISENNHHHHGGYYGGYGGGYYRPYRPYRCY